MLVRTTIVVPDSVLEAETALLKRGLAQNTEAQAHLGGGIEVRGDFMTIYGDSSSDAGLTARSFLIQVRELQKEIPEAKVMIEVS